MVAWQPSMEKASGNPWKPVLYLHTMPSLWPLRQPAEIPDTKGLLAFAICIHHIQTKERVGSLTGICPGQAPGPLLRPRAHVTSRTNSTWLSSTRPFGMYGTHGLPTRNSQTSVKDWNKRTLRKSNSCSSRPKIWTQIPTAKPSSRTHKPKPLRQHS